MTLYVRGGSVALSVTFKDADGDPLVPIDSLNPMVTIKDPAGAIAASGVGTQQTTPGDWGWSWSVPAGATLGTGWTIEWIMTTASNEVCKQTEVVEVSDQLQFPDSLDREAAYFTICDTSERLLFRNLTQLYDLTLTIYFQNEVWASYSKDQLTEVFADGLYTWYVESPQLSDSGEYLVIWSVLQTQTSQRETVIQHLRVAGARTILVLPYLRGLVDKLNKVQDTPLSYTDSELASYLTRGLDLVNSVLPRTEWVAESLPNVLVSWWVLASGWWALQARGLLEIEVSHEFSGQSVNLSYDHHSPLSDYISRWENLLWEKLPPTKIAIFRQAAGPGTIAVRPYRLGVENRVYRAGASQNALADFPGLLGSIGLLW